VKKSLLFWSVAFVIAAALFAGCAGHDNSSTPTPNTSGAPAVSTIATVSPAATPVSPAATAPPAVGVHCGTERWPVKTLSDPDAGNVSFAPVQTTVAQMRSLPTPGALPESSRIAPTELTVFSVIALVKEFKLEDDQDIHLVIADPSDANQTMIVEFPDASRCSGAVNSAHAAEMMAARQAMIGAFGQPSSSHFKSISGTATITGVAFFDFKHGQTGVAPNAIELHPVVSFSQR